jgi:oleate hydratase
MADVQRNKAKAYLVGGGIAALASAVYLIREGGLTGENIHIFEQGSVTGGALDGSGSPQDGYLIRGGRMIEAHFGCTWDLLSGIPSLDDPHRSVKDECDEFNRRLVSGSHCRLLRDGEKVDVSSYGLSNQDSFDMLKLMFRSEESLGDARIVDCFAPAFLTTTFWLLWQTTFAFQTWSSAAEMRRYFIRFIHLLPGFNQLKGILRTVYNQYDSVILPIERWLKDRGVNILLHTYVTGIEFDLNAERKTATALRYATDGKEQRIELAAGDYVFITNGSMVESSSTGSMTSAPVLGSKAGAGSWALWERIAEKSPDFGRPSTFCDHVDLSKWESFTVTLEDAKFFEFMETFTGNIAGTGGLVTFTDSNWLMSVVLAHQPHFRGQPENVHVFWGYGLFPDKPGDRVDKKMSECTGEEIIKELCHHLKITDKEGEYFSRANCIPCMMPFIDSQFLPRKPGDRPQVAPHGATNFAFVGQFAELPDDCVFTVEYSVRTAQTAVYSLLELDQEVTPIYQGHHDIHVLIDALSATRR